MSKAWVLALRLCMFVIPLAWTQDQYQDLRDSGNVFLSVCGESPDSSSKAPPFQRGACYGYVLGVDDGVRMTYDIQDQTQPYCLPDEVTTGQTVRILIKFIKDHPEKAHSQTRVLVVESLMDAFPCKGKKK